MHRRLHPGRWKRQGRSDDWFFMMTSWRVWTSSICQDRWVQKRYFLRKNATVLIFQLVFLFQVIRQDAEGEGLILIPRKLVIHWNSAGTNGQDAFTFLNGKLESLHLRNSDALLQKFRKKICKIAGEFKKVQGQKERTEYLEGNTHFIIHKNDIVPKQEIFEEMEEWKTTAEEWRIKCGDQEDEAATFYFQLMQERDEEKEAMKQMKEVNTESPSSLSPPPPPPPHTHTQPNPIQHSAGIKFSYFLFVSSDHRAMQGRLLETLRQTAREQREKGADTWRPATTKRNAPTAGKHRLSAVVRTDLRTWTEGRSPGWWRKGN